MWDSISQGVWIGLIIGVGIVVVFFLIAANRKPDFNAKQQRTAAIESNLAPAAAIERLKERAGANGLKVALTDANGTRIILAEGMTLFSWGMYFPISARAEGAGSIVTVGLSPRAPQYGPVLTHKINKAADKVRAMLAGA
jgi:hypothetical protein